MKAIWLYLIFLLFNFNSAFSQQVSISIPFGNKTNEIGWHIDQVENDFVITTAARCKIDENVPSESCCVMVRVNSKGEILWKKIIEFDTEFTSRPGSQRANVIRNDSIIVSGFVSRHDSLLMRIYIVLPSGNLLKQIDYYIPYLFSNNGILALPDGYLVYNTLRDTTKESFDYQFIKLDRAFQIINELKLGKQSKRANTGTATLLDDNSILVAMEEWNIPQPGKNIALIRINDICQLKYLKEVNNNTTDFLSLTPRIQSYKDFGVFIWHFKSFKNIPDTPAYPITLFKFDSLYNLIWEKPLRVYRGEYISGDFIFGSDGNLYLAGSYYRSLGDEIGWLSKRDRDGEVIWERCFVDSSKKKLHQYFYNIIEVKSGGFALTGLMTDTFERHDPSEYNANIWFLTLDHNGCFNGDCKDTINVGMKLSTGYPNLSFDLSQLLEFYPNPTSEFVNIEFRTSAKRTITLLDMNGRHLMNIVTLNANVKIDVKEFLTGSYYLKIEDSQGKCISIPIKVIH